MYLGSVWLVNHLPRNRRMEHPVVGERRLPCQDRLGGLLGLERPAHGMSIIIRGSFQRPFAWVSELPDHSTGLCYLPATLGCDIHRRARAYATTCTSIHTLPYIDLWKRRSAYDGLVTTLGSYIRCTEIAWMSGLSQRLPQTWLAHLLQMADDDPDVILARLNKEEEGSVSPQGLTLQAVAQGHAYAESRLWGPSINGIAVRWPACTGSTC